MSRITDEMVERARKATGFFCGEGDMRAALEAVADELAVPGPFAFSAVDMRQLYGSLNCAQSTEAQIAIVKELVVDKALRTLGPVQEPWPVPYEQARASDKILPAIAWDENDYEVAQVVRRLPSDAQGARRVCLYRNMTRLAVRPDMHFDAAVKSKSSGVDVIADLCETGFALVPHGNAQEAQGSEWTQGEAAQIFSRVERIQRKEPATTKFKALARVLNALHPRGKVQP